VVIFAVWRALLMHKKQRKVKPSSSTINKNVRIKTLSLSRTLRGPNYYFLPKAIFPHCLFAQVMCLPSATNHNQTAAASTPQTIISLHLKAHFSGNKHGHNNQE
jgi:hypothetical protein